MKKSMLTENDLDQIHTQMRLVEGDGSAQYNLDGDVWMGVGHIELWGLDVFGDPARVGDLVRSEGDGWKFEAVRDD